MTEKRFKKSVSGTLATGIILEKELSTDEVFNELIKLEKENKKLKEEIEALKMEISELRESEKDNYNITDGLW